MGDFQQCAVHVQRTPVQMPGHRRADGVAATKAAAMPDAGGGRGARSVLPGHVCSHLCRHACRHVYRYV